MYTNTVKYISPTILTTGEVNKLWFLPRPETDFASRHFECFNHKFYKQVIVPPFVKHFPINSEALEQSNVNVLRLLLKDSNSADIALPNELLIFKNLILHCCNHYAKIFPDLYTNFLYLTVRTTDNENYYKNSSDWHVDGFQGSRIARHKPELNFIWCNKFGTEFAVEPYNVDDFDYSKYNINSYFRDNTVGNDIMKSEPECIYMMDPYMVHRAPQGDFPEKRVFLRLNVSPVEIEDWTNTVNPMLPKFYEKRTDVRDLLADK